MLMKSEVLVRIKLFISQPMTSFVDLLCFCSVLCLLCFVGVCLYVLCGHLLDRADLLALVCGVFCEFVTFPLVSSVRCGT